MRMQFDATQIDDPSQASRVVDDDFFCGSSGRKRKRDRTQPTGPLLRRPLLIKSWGFGPVHKPLKNNRTVPNSGQRARRNRQIITDQVEFCYARLREVSLVGMGNTDFTSINREQLAGFVLGHPNRLTSGSDRDSGAESVRSYSRILRETSQCHEEWRWESWIKSFAGMYRHCCPSSIRMLQENVAAASASNFKVQLFENADDLFAFKPWKAGHTEICWTPTSSKGLI